MSQSHAEAVQSLREKAAKYTRMADELEAEFGPVKNTVTSPKTNTSQVTADLIKSAIKLKGMRPKALAEHFKTTEDVISSFIKPENHLRIDVGGWVADMDAK